MIMLYLHKHIFLTDITGYDRLKFSYIHTLQNEILVTPLIPLSAISNFRSLRLD